MNAGPNVIYSNVRSLRMITFAGDDDIDIDVDTLALGLTFFDVFPADPTTGGGDTITVRGNAATWQPGPLWLQVDGSTLRVNGTEKLIFDGEGAGTLTVIGTALADLFVHTPGPAADEGTVDVSDTTSTLLGISYTNLGLAGTVTVAGLGDDSLVALGTHASDSIAVDFTGPNAVVIDLISTAGNHVNLLSTGVENYALDLLEGDDDIFLNGTIQATSFLVQGGGPGGSDELIVDADDGIAQTITVTPDSSDEQDITGLGATIDVAGIELIVVEGDTVAADDLTVDLGLGNATARVQNAASGNDVVVSDVMPNVEFTSIDEFELAGGGDTTVATFLTDSLSGAATYTFTSFDDDTLIIEGNSQADDFTVSLDIAGDLQIADNNGVTVFTSNMTDVNQLILNTLGGEDLVTVNVAGTALVDTPITFNGGDGLDLLRVTGTPIVLAALDTVTYNPGPGAASGRLTYENAAGTRLMTIDFDDLEPVIDLVTAPNLVVNGTNGNNAINYVEGPNSGGLRGGGAETGLVSVDGFETIEFANKASLTINGLSGDDVINLNDGDATAPDGLTGITVNGGDPAASDTVIVNGTAALNAIVVDQFTTDGARITGAQAVPVTVATTEHLTIHGQGGDDMLTIQTPVGAQLIFLDDDSAVVDTGSVVMRDFIAAGGAALLPMNFLGLGGSGSIAFTDIGGGRVDELTVTPRVNGDVGNIFNLSAAGVLDLDDASAGLTNQQMLFISTAGVTDLNLVGLAGDDTFNIVGGNAFTNIDVQGGAGDDDDTLVLTSPTAARIVNFGTSTITGYGAPITYSGLQTIDVDADDDVVQVVGGDEDEDITVTVWDESSGTVQRGLAVQQNGQVQSPIADPLLIYRNTSGAALNVDLGLGDNTLIVVGSSVTGLGSPPIAFDQLFSVDVPNATITIDDDPFNSPGANGVVTWANADSLSVFGLEGDDQFDVTPGAIPIFIDGGDPIGETAGDLINVLAAMGAVTFETGPEPDEGGFIVAGSERISFDHIESLGVLNAGCALIIGTNADDDITVIARDDSTHAGANGVQDFTTTINSQLEILWIDTHEVYIDGLSGDDDIVVRAPAPNRAVWDVDVFVAGGPPSAGDGNGGEGDTLVVETPYGDDTATYTPTSPDSGFLNLATTGGVSYANIIIGQFVADCDGNGVPDYVSSPGGVENLIYDGVSAEGGTDINGNQTISTAFTDQIVVVGDGVNQATSDDRFIHTPGSAPDAGRVDIENLTNGQSMLALQYNNIGLTGTVSIDGQDGEDTLVALGTDGSDDLAAAFTGVDIIAI